jgi:hypothetical protein
MFEKNFMSHESSSKRYTIDEVVLKFFTSFSSRHIMYENVCTSVVRNKKKVNTSVFFKLKKKEI